MNTIVSNYRGSYINSNSREGRRNSCIQPTTNPRISMIGNPGNSRIENPGICEARRMSSMYNDIQPTAGFMNHKKSSFVEIIHKSFQLSFSLHNQTIVFQQTSLESERLEVTLCDHIKCLEKSSVAAQYSPNYEDPVDIYTPPKAINADPRNNVGFSKKGFGSVTFYNKNYVYIIQKIGEILKHNQIFWVKGS